MKVKDTEDYILITKEVGDSDESFQNAFETGVVTLMVGKETRKINGLKIWKSKKAIKDVGI